MAPATESYVLYYKTSCQGTVHIFLRPTRVQDEVLFVLEVLPVLRGGIEHVVLAVVVAREGDERLPGAELGLLLFKVPERQGTAVVCMYYYYTHQYENSSLAGIEEPELSRRHPVVVGDPVGTEVGGQRYSLPVGGPKVLRLEVGPQVAAVARVSAEGGSQDLEGAC